MKSKANITLMIQALVFFILKSISFFLFLFWPSDRLHSVVKFWSIFKTDKQQLTLTIKKCVHREKKVISEDPVSTSRGPEKSRTEAQLQISSKSSCLQSRIKHLLIHGLISKKNCYSQSYVIHPRYLMWHRGGAEGSELSSPGGTVDL